VAEATQRLQALGRQLLAVGQVELHQVLGVGTAPSAPPPALPLPLPIGGWEGVCPQGQC
jgi:hypothetical protein